MHTPDRSKTCMHRLKMVINLHFC